MFNTEPEEPEEVEHIFTADNVALVLGMGMQPAPVDICDAFFGSATGPVTLVVGELCTPADPDDVQTWSLFFNSDALAALRAFLDDQVSAWPPAFQTRFTASVDQYRQHARVVRMASIEEGKEDV